MSRHSDNEQLWGWLLLLSAALIAIIAIFKIIFWISIATVIIGFIWAIVLIIQNWGEWDFDLDSDWIPLVLLFGGIVLAFVSYQIGYGMEQSPGGSQLIDLANTILGVEKTRTEIPQQIARETINAVANATGE